MLSLRKSIYWRGSKAKGESFEKGTGDVFLDGAVLTRTSQNDVCFVQNGRARDESKLNHLQQVSEGHLVIRWFLSNGCCRKQMVLPVLAAMLRKETARNPDFEELNSPLLIAPRELADVASFWVPKINSHEHQPSHHHLKLMKPPSLTLDPSSVASQLQLSPAIETMIGQRKKQP